MSLSTAQATSPTGVKITEWMYNPLGSPGEFVEFTNFGPTAVSFAGWSFDDNTRSPGSEDLSSFGTVASGESVIITEAAAAGFRTAWNLSVSVKVIGGITNNLGCDDEINLYNNANVLVDRLTFGDDTLGGPRTQGKSGEPISVSAIGANSVTQWKLSTVGDSEGSYASIGGDIGSPDKTAFVVAVPELQSYATLLAGLGFIGVVTQRKQRNK
ncbi:MAG TPA: lamin tail domain-containing protein [Rhodocyclaceae bacterium]|nr:lamin tail domain-containing protein [Rhodocyclaceae bacterium]